MICVVCGKEFLSKSYKRLCCSDECSDINRLQIKREHYIRKRDGIEGGRSRRYNTDYIKLTKKEQRKRYRERHAEKIKKRNKEYNEEKRMTVIKNRNLKKTFNLTLEEYNLLKQSQGGVCKLCKKEETGVSKLGYTKALAVDHCHDTGAIRGLLCSKCNRGLGYFKDCTDLLKRAILYIETKGRV